MNTTTARIVELLRATPDGLPATEIVARLNLTDGQVRAAVGRSNSVYIDRWQSRNNDTGGPHAVAVWCYTETLQENCPRPEILPRTGKRRAA